MPSSPEYWVLVETGHSRAFRAEHVFRLFSTDRAIMGDTLLMFTQGDTADAVRASLASVGYNLIACKLGTADEITDLLSRLLDLGTTHVSINIDPRNPVYRPIGPLILDIEVSGGDGPLAR